MGRNKFKAILFSVTPIGAAATMLRPIDMPTVPIMEVNPMMATQGYRGISNYKSRRPTGNRTVRNRNILSSTKPER